MPSTFFGLNIASSGLSAYQVAVNTTANNISNVKTDGYSRQVANRTQAESLRVYAKYGTTGSGVETTSITRVRDEYYDVKYWINNSSLGLYERKVYYMNQIEDYFIDDDTTKGFTTILNNMFNNLDTLSDSAADMDKRKSFISSCQNFATYFNSVAVGLSQVQTDANLEVKSAVDNINAIAKKIALINNQINTIEMQGGHANELRDQRALLLDELSQIVPIETNEVEVMDTNNEYYVGCTEFTVTINGQTLVDTREYRQLECKTRENRINQSDVDGLYDIVWADTGTDFNATAKSMSGSLKALLDVRDGNNEENFRGTVQEASGNKLVITNPTQASVEKMTMPEEGTLTICNKKFSYSAFEVEFDGNGNATYTFTLDDNLSTTAGAGLLGHEAAIGESVDFMGIPYYNAQLNEFLRAFTANFNDIEMTGQDLNGDPMKAFFVAKNMVTGDEEDLLSSDQYTTVSSSINSYYKMTASSFKVSKRSEKDASFFSSTTDVVGKPDAYELIDKLMPLKSEGKLYRGSGADGFLQCIISDISVDAEESKLFYENYNNIEKTITNQRLSVSGVDEDEEALDLVKFQNAYNLASKMISVMAEMYDQLILNTAV